MPSFSKEYDASDNVVNWSVFSKNLGRIFANYIVLLQGMISLLLLMSGVLIVEWLLSLLYSVFFAFRAPTKLFPGKKF